jgi:hypothetical protein
MSFSTEYDLIHNTQVALKHIRAGNLPAAERLLRQVLAAQPDNEQAWLMLAYTAQTVEDKRQALGRALKLNPNNAKVRAALTRLVDSEHVRQAARGGVFISYTRSDEVFVAQLAEDLQVAGVPIWVDMFDIPDGTDWHDEIERALQRCHLMVAVLSPAALRAGNWRAELSRFMDSGKLIVPILYRPCDISAIPFWHEPVNFTGDYSGGLQYLTHLLTTPAPARTGTYGAVR